MAVGDSNIPVPDPTVATNDAVERAVRAERDYVDGRFAVIVQRLAGIDKATEVLNETVNRVPTDVTKEVSHLSELMTERFDSVDKQFKERDTRSERESKDNKVAVDAAFAAQKEAASEQNKSNTLAITKSEIATAETINKLAELVRTQIAGLEDKVGDAKERIGRIENRKEGAIENKGESHETFAALRSYANVILVGVALLISYLAFHRNAAATPPVTVPVPTVVTVTVPKP